MSEGSVSLTPAAAGDCAVAVLGGGGGCEVLGPKTAHCSLSVVWCNGK